MAYGLWRDRGAPLKAVGIKQVRSTYKLFLFRKLSFDLRLSARSTRVIFNSDRVHRTNFYFYFFFIVKNKIGSTRAPIYIDP